MNRWILLVALAGCSDHSIEDDLNSSGQSSDGLSYPACGAVTASWNGFDARSNGNDSGTGNSCAGRGKWGLQYQCVELVMRYFGVNYGLTWLGNAKDLLNNAPRGSINVFYNGDSAHPPKPGDMLVFPPGGNVGGLGHVVLVTSVPGGHIDIIQQNIAGVTTGYATLPYDGTRAHGPSGWKWPDPQGWARPRGSDPTPPSSDPCANATAGGLYCGSSRENGFTGGDSNTIYDCENGGTAGTSHCAYGCTVAPSGQNDSCQPAPSNPPAPDPCARAQYGGLYCGASRENGFTGGDSDSIYDCENGVTKSKTACANGCIVAPSGQNDSCKADPCIAAQYGGLYCGQSTQYGFTGGIANDLYDCENHATQSRTACANGCNVAPPGQNDACK